MKFKSILFALIGLLTIEFGYTQNSYKTIEEVEGAAVGYNVNDFSAVDLDGNTFNLKMALNDGPAF